MLQRSLKEERKLYPPQPPTMSTYERLSDQWKYNRVLKHIKSAYNLSCLCFHTQVRMLQSSPQNLN